MKHIAFGVGCLCLATVSARAAEPQEVAAQVAPAAPATSEWRPVTSGPLVAYTSALTPQHHLTFQPMVFASAIRAKHDADGSLVPHQDSGLSVATSLFAEYGLGASTAAGAQLNVLFNQASAPAHGTASTTGFGDTLLFVRHRLPLRDEGSRPQVALFGQLKAPTGKADGARSERLGTDLTGNGAWEPGAGVNLTSYLRPVVVHADVIGVLPAAADLDGVRTRPGPALYGVTAAEIPLFGGAFAAMIELSGRVQARQVVEGRGARGTSANELCAGLGFEWIMSDTVQLLVGYQRTMAGANVSAHDTLAVTLVPVL